MIADMSRPLKRLPQERDELVTLGRHAAGAAQTPAAG
jgi:hypothetical protein